MLEDILEAHKYEYRTQDRAKDGVEWVEHIKTTKYTYEARAFFFPGDDTVKWYWIDFDEEWP